ncbi:glutathione S-transferase [Alphaproteobacteria bacterium]|nr:glutathione S-transferase [Alphaproteobacteria bacterium]
MSISIIYLNFPFWRAEVSRIALHIGKIKYDDIRVERDEFMRARSLGKLDNGTIIPFHQLPCLIVDDESIGQTAGIARYCGKLSGLYPTDENLLAAKIDQYIDLMTDITVLTFNAGRDLKPKEKIIKRKEFFDQEFTRKFKMLEEHISNNGKTIITKNFNISDIALWSFVNWITSGTIDGFPKNILKKYPKIQKVFKYVNELPEIKNWVKNNY